MTATLHRSLALEDVEVTTGKYSTLEGRAVPYWVWTDVGLYLEQWAAHALNATTVNGTRSLPLLLFHDNRSFPIGHSTGWSSASDGLHGRWQLNDTSDAQTAARLADRGDLSGLSIGFQAEQSEWRFADNFNPELGWDHMDRVTRQSARLLEVSIVSTPAFADAEVTGVRSAARTTPRRHFTEEMLDAHPQSVTAWKVRVRYLRDKYSVT